LKPIPRNPSLEALKITLGGLLAFPVAYLILLWGIGKDPLQVAPALSRTIPFIVPKSMRPKPVLEETAERPRRSRVDDLEEPQIEINPTREDTLLDVPDVSPGKNGQDREEVESSLYP
jgi:hypothetical protein